MRVAATSDWRSSIPFETPVVVADIAPGDPTRCFTCGADSELVDRAALWAYKHRHPNHHDGYVRFYCSAHVPAARRTPPVAPARRAPRTPRSETPARRPQPSTEITRALCPDCFVEVSANGACGMCGRQVS